MNIKESIEPLLKERKLEREKLNKITNAIEALRNLCNHEFTEQWYDSHKTHHKCKFCSKKESW